MHTVASLHKEAPKKPLLCMDYSDFTSPTSGVKKSLVLEPGTS